ncbi:hypothetical protein GDO81_030189 [Engystomops pustulosus]|uniref:Uncharacterized protein n=1 Tax=Engystomops pustulosus TaxID=76066 RepID=A0AAV6ZLP2_ENGPU|nr:hypothetical protein GDO81_030189 [Engystomops pustulosus]
MHISLALQGLSFPINAGVGRGILYSHEYGYVSCLSGSFEDGSVIWKIVITAPPIYVQSDSEAPRGCVHLMPQFTQLPLKSKKC